MGAHIASQKTYFTVTVALLMLLVVKVGLAYVHIGIWSLVLTLTVATAKALLVILYFMHVRWSTRLVWAVASVGVVWLLVMFALMMSDYLTRGDVHYMLNQPPVSHTVNER